MHVVLSPPWHVRTSVDSRCSVPALFLHAHIATGDQFILARVGETNREALVAMVHVGGPEDPPLALKCWVDAYT